MNTEVMFEHRFWLQILGDHSRFIFNTLSPKEIQDIQTAQHFIQSYDQLLSVARNPLNADEIVTLNQQAYSLTIESCS